MCANTRWFPGVMGIIDYIASQSKLTAHVAYCPDYACSSVCRQFSQRTQTPGCTVTLHFFVAESFNMKYI